MMSSRKHRSPRRSNVVRGPFKKQQNPVEGPKAAGVNVKQVVWIGALTALTGTVVGAVATEMYRYFRRKLPIPPPAAPGQVAQNPYGVPYAQPLPPGWAPAPPMPPASFAQNPGQFVPAAVQQIQPQQQPQYSPPAPSYFTPPALPAGAYAQNGQQALPPAASVPVVPSPPSSNNEPLSRPELAQWQRRLEGWERDLDRRDREH